MANIIRIKRRLAPGLTGSPSSLHTGELAYNENDGVLYYGFGDAGGGIATNVISIAGSGVYCDLVTNQTIGGIKTFTLSPIVPTPTTAMQAATKDYVDTRDYPQMLHLSGGTMTGTINFAAQIISGTGNIYAGAIYENGQNISVVYALSGQVPPNHRTIIAGSGLTGGGDFSANRIINLAIGSGLYLQDDLVGFDIAAETARLNILYTASGYSYSKAESDTRYAVSGSIVQGSGLYMNGSNLHVGSGYGITVTDSGVMLALAQTDARYQLSGAAQIGVAEDASYTDGLFTDFVPSTPVGTAVDRFNEVLKSLAPQPAPSLSSLNSTTNGTTVKLSFGAGQTITNYANVAGIGDTSAVAVDGTFTLDSPSNRRLGTFGFAGQTNPMPATLTGNIADSASAGGGSPTPAYSGTSFGDALTGNLLLELNGVTVRTVDLTTAGIVSDAGTGFTLTSGWPSRFPNGDAFNVFWHRQGTWRVASSGMTSGWNYVRVRHEYAPSTFRDTTYADWVYDPYVGNCTFYQNQSGVFSSGTATRYLTGVKYYTQGSGTYMVGVSGLYKNTYATASNITYAVNSTYTNAMTATTIGACGGNEDLGVGVAAAWSYKTNIQHSDHSALTFTATANRGVQTANSSTTVSVSGYLIDTITDDTTALFESFNYETWRMDPTGNFDSFRDGDYASTTDIKSAANQYVSGLQCRNGRLYVPGTNWSLFANGPTGNPNYSTGMQTGAWQYYRSFKQTGATTHSNFSITLQGSGPTFIAAATAFTTVNEMKMEMRAPTQTGWMDCYNDFVTATWTDGAGCRYSAAGAGRALATTWGLTIGTKSTADTGSRIYIRITVPNNFAVANYLDSLTWAWL